MAEVRTFRGIFVGAITGVTLGREEGVAAVGGAAAAVVDGEAIRDAEPVHEVPGELGAVRRGGGERQEGEPRALDGPRHVVGSERTGGGGFFDASDLVPIVVRAEDSSAPSHSPGRGVKPTV